MKISRTATNLIRFFIDECVPPVLRDSRLFMWLPLKLWFGENSGSVFTFKDDLLRMSEAELIRFYEELECSAVERETDLNAGCLREIQSCIVGDKVLEVGCGRGFLSSLLAEKYKVTACDFVDKPDFAAKNEFVFKRENVEKLSFDNDEFDTVVCAHTLEHVINISTAVSELRRVAAKRLIIIVPKQRPYRYTPDLHIHFFPYAHSFLAAVGTRGVKCELHEIEGDWFYREDFPV
ncbi:MAG: methyltransferase domain-containing protein [Candidatus Dadabacteria bacterium]|nr:methyltransferase domain-containing protein [Candidatus Dadabacteria bacterium]